MEVLKRLGLQTVLFAVLLSVGLPFNAQAASLGDPLESLPMQDSGRLKPFDTFARETLQLIYGKRSYEKRSAAEVVFTWLLVPEHWINTPFIELRHKGLKEALKITSDDRYYSPQSLLTNERVPLVFQELRNLRDRQEKLNPYFQAVQRLENQLGLFQGIRMGHSLRFVPDPNSDKWKSVEELEGEPKEAFVALAKGFIDSVTAAKDKAKPSPSPEFEQAVKNFIAVARAQSPDKYAEDSKIYWEEHLNHFHPFMWSWVVYLLALMVLLLNSASRWKWANGLFWVLLLSGLALHTYGMILRVYLSGRPPVSNMYETVVWVPWGCVVFGLILYWTQKSKLLLTTAAAVSIFCLILTDLAPTVLDASIHPLEPVLRSTLWLTTHVLIITISYAAFFLAFGIADVLLVYYLIDEKKYARQLQVGTQSIYRCLQIGIVLLAFGIILGGIWADYSWGRFWGWDPKETWALIALLGYVALLHGRLVGWVKNFELATGSIVAFALVIMAWYGVNFVLGAGLHSYGFGAGGVEWVTGFVVLHLLYVAYVSTVRYGRLKKESKG